MGDPSAAGGGSPAIKLPSEPVLDGVLEDDRLNVRNIIYVMHALRVCKSWSVLPKNTGYEVVGMIDTANSPEIELRDLETVKKVDPLRINSVAVRMIGNGGIGGFSLVVFVQRKNEPIVLDEQDVVVSIRKKRRFWDWMRRDTH